MSLFLRSKPLAPLSFSEEWHTFDYLWHLGLEKGVTRCQETQNMTLVGSLSIPKKSDSVTCAHPSSRELDYYKNMFPMCSDEASTVMSARRRLPGRTGSLRKKVSRVFRFSKQMFSWRYRASLLGCLRMWNAILSGILAFQYTRIASSYVEMFM
ncbi:hypothetical protein CDAR_492721 [Caerostris darwini]|uniref:Uncharacterized protein n=1 Tax=Caerostris darwini TaxID=1538125 RepID=A0AAV4UYW4_9ARAC|nr:hypothetical protein CDAR_492721 [Caerostris darwini]